MNKVEQKLSELNLNGWIDCINKTSTYMGDSLIQTKFHITVEKMSRRKKTVFAMQLSNTIMGAISALASLESLSRKEDRDRKAVIRSMNWYMYYVYEFITDVPSV